MAAEKPVGAPGVSHALSATLSQTVVSVQAPGKESSSGVVVSSDGLIITASTVLAFDTSAVQVRFADGRLFLADIVATDRATESALLRLRSAKSVRFGFLTIGDSSKAAVGSRVISAGNPLDSISADCQIAVSVGSITGKYVVCSCDSASCYCGEALETDAAINAGSEGGALLNENGHLMGMLCLAVDRTRMKGTAIPIHRIRSAYATHLPDAPVYAGSASASASIENALSASLTFTLPGRNPKKFRGIAIDSEGHVLTAGLLDIGQRVDVELANGEITHATVSLQSKTLDVSLLQLEHKASKWMALQGTVPIAPGIPVTIVSKTASSISMNWNIVSAVERLEGTAAQTDARLNESDAGAVVLNTHGDLIGIVSHTRAVREYGSQNAGVSFFTTASTIQAWLGHSAGTPTRCDEPLAKLVAASSDAFVFIGDGSGVLISEDGYALTNYHVAGERDTWSVRIGSETKTRLCDVVSRDAKRDLCLIKIRGVEHAPFVKMGSSSALESGQGVLALGDPFKLGELSGGPAASLGVISALHRHQGRYADAIQTDCSINPGNSGGPLLNLNGELVGINGQIISRYGKNNTGIAFAIPIDQIKLLFADKFSALVASE